MEQNKTSSVIKGILAISILMSPLASGFSFAQGHHPEKFTSPAAVKQKIISHIRLIALADAVFFRKSIESFNIL